MINIFQSVVHDILDDYETPSEQLQEDIRQLKLIIETEIKKGSDINDIINRIKKISKSVNEHNAVWSNLLYFIEQQYHLKQYFRENDILDRIQMRFTHDKKLNTRLEENSCMVEYVNFLYDDSCLIFQPNITYLGGESKMITTAIIPRNLFFIYYFNAWSTITLSDILDTATESCINVYEDETPISLRDIRHINSGVLMEISKIKP